MMVYYFVPILVGIAITEALPIKCNDGQFLDETSTCLVCHHFCSTCTSFGTDVIQNGCICNLMVYKNETSLYCTSEDCPFPPAPPAASECIKASEFNFFNGTQDYILKTADDARWLFLIAAILACCCFCCAG